MAITKARKEELVALYKDLIERGDAVFITDYTGMTVKQLEGVRGAIREVDGSFHVTKNTLLRIALEETGSPVPTELLKGQVGATFSLGEAPTLAKTLLKVAKDQEAFTLKGVVFGTQILSEDQIEDLSEMPTIDVVRAQLLGMLSGQSMKSKLVGIFSAPARDIATVLSNSVSQLVNVIQAYSQKEEEEGAAA